MAGQVVYFLSCLGMVSGLFEGFQFLFSRNGPYPHCFKEGNYGAHISLLGYYGSLVIMINMGYPDKKNKFCRHKTERSFNKNRS